MCRSSTKRCALIGTLALASILAVTVSNVSADKSDPPNPDWYFWNEVSGETQWEDPGDVPYENADASRYWLSSTSVRTDYDPNAHKYAWVENWSEEHKRPFYYNQKTKESMWEKPMDLAWRRVRSKNEL